MHSVAVRLRPVNNPQVFTRLTMAVSDACCRSDRHCRRLVNHAGAALHSIRALHSVVIIMVSQLVSVTDERRHSLRAQFSINLCDHLDEHSRDREHDSGCCWRVLLYALIKCAFARLCVVATTSV